MKIQSVAISNILSFGHRRGKFEAPDLAFDTEGNHGSLHILIGPNGSGKSNFIEVLNQIFKNALNKPAIAKLEVFRNWKKDSPTMARPKALEFIQTTSQRMSEHYGMEGKAQEVRITIAFNDYDRTNMLWLSTNAAAVNECLSSNMSGLPRPVPTNCTPAQIAALQSVDVSIGVKETKAIVSMIGEAGPKALAYFYLEYFELLQQAIALHNCEFKDDLWPLFRRTFALLGGSRDVAEVEGSTQLTANKDDLLAQASKRTNEESARYGQTQVAAVFTLVKTRLGAMYAETTMSMDKGPRGTVALLQASQLVTDLNALLAKYLSLEFRIDVPESFDGQLTFSLWDKRRNRRLHNSELSSGERGILHLVFSLFGYELEHGMVLIDEPELHLHPQLQRSYLEVLQEVRQKRDIQVIIATHSPVFVNSETIRQVYRFKKNLSGSTEIVPAATLKIDRTLVRTLDYSNAAKAFFAKKVVLVEGPTDEYFLKHLIARLQSAVAADVAERLRELEVIDIGGKGGCDEFEPLLRGFGLEVYYVGDWDNISSVYVIDLEALKEWVQQITKDAGTSIVSKGSGDGEELIRMANTLCEAWSPEAAEQTRQTIKRILQRNIPYSEIVAAIRGKNAPEWKKIADAIAENRKKWKYILEKGELEDYLGLKRKGVNAMIAFCATDFENWFTNPAFKDFKDELVNLITEIAQR